MNPWIVVYVVGNDMTWRGLSVAVVEPPLPILESAIGKFLGGRNVYDGNLKASYSRRIPIISFPVGSGKMDRARARLRRSNGLLMDVDFL